MQLLIWFLMLVLQNAAFTWVSRARNSGSYLYHGIAAVFSNGIFFAMQYTMFSIFMRPNMTSNDILLYGSIYIIGTVTGSLLMHWIAINYLEKGKRKVGA